MFRSSREIYINLGEEEQSKFLDQMTAANGQDFTDAFIKFVQTGDYAQFSEEVDGPVNMEQATNTVELPVGQVVEGGTTMAEGYDRNPAQIQTSAAMNGTNVSFDSYNAAPIQVAVERMGEEYRAMVPEKREALMDKVEASKGEEFSESLKMALSNRNFCQAVGRETQVFFDQLRRDFSISKNKRQFISNVSDFSEHIGSDLVDYATGRKVRSFSVLEAAGYVAMTARRDFSENGVLGEALQELADGDISPTAAETMAENLEATAAPSVVDGIVDAAGRDQNDEEYLSAEDPVETSAVLREKEQGNDALIAVVEKYKNLETPEAKAAMKEKMEEVLGSDLAEYVVSRAEGAEFSEDTSEDDVDAAEAKAEAPLAEAPIPDYDNLANELVGEDLYVESPAAQITAATAPVAEATLPEASPVIEGGTTLPEGYQRIPTAETIEAEYAAQGLMG